MKVLFSGFVIKRLKKFSYETCPVLSVTEANLIAQPAILMRYTLYLGIYLISFCPTLKSIKKKLCYCNTARAKVKVIVSFILAFLKFHIFH